MGRINSNHNLQSPQVVDQVNNTDLNISTETAIQPTTYPPKLSLEFPIWGLPKIAQRMIIEGSTVYGAHTGFFASGILGAMSAVLKKKIVLRGKYNNYAQLWLVDVAPSGIGKSEPLKIAFRPIEKLDMELDERYSNEMDKWKADCITAAKSKPPKPQPKEPICPQYLISDTTPEALYKVIRESKGVTICRDELAGMFEDFGRYSKNGEVENMLGIASNSPIRINRKSERKQQIPDPFLALIGTIQPSVLSKNMKVQGMKDNGFPQRILFIYPDNIKKPYYSDLEMTPETIAEYEAFILTLNGRWDHGSTSHEFRFSEEVKLEFAKFANELTDKVNSIEVEYLKSLYAKMEIHLCRLSLTVFAGKVAAGEALGYEIDLPTIQYCIELCRYFIHSREKVYRLISDQSAPVSKLSNQELICEIFTKYNITNQSQLASALGITPQAISKALKQ